MTVAWRDTLDALDAALETATDVDSFTGAVLRNRLARVGGLYDHKFPPPPEPDRSTTVVESPEHTAWRITVAGHLGQLDQVAAHVDGRPATTIGVDLDAAATTVFGRIEAALGGIEATSAQLDASGATYPTGFAGGEELLFDLDGATVSVVFLPGDEPPAAADQQLSQVISRINNTLSSLGLEPAASEHDGQLRLTSPSTGSQSTIDNVGGTAAAALGLGGSPTAAGYDAAEPSEAQASLLEAAMAFELPAEPPYYVEDYYCDPSSTSYIDATGDSRPLVFGGVGELELALQAAIDAVNEWLAVP